MGDAVQPLLALSSLSCHYGKTPALRGVDIEVNEGELVTIVGANGAGKTTLLRAISGVLPIHGGSITFEGESITKMAAHHRCEVGICHVPEGRLMFADLTVADNIYLGGYAHRRDKSWIKKGTEWVYELFPILQDKAQDRAGTLSGGQQQMVAIGRALMGRPRLLLLDEPSMGLAPLLVADIFRVIRQLNQEEGLTCLMVEQNAKAALKIAQRGYVLETGGVTLSASASDLLANEEIRKAYLGH
ncbi:MAG: ABC transporter ATP-binding protein [Magnetococcales bacterium]|nr:ABC transporter ATP-binding protein [Magnetococcales bacterium]